MRTANLQYKEILSTLKPEMTRFEEMLTFCVSENENNLKGALLDFINAPSKRIRPVLMFLTLKSLGLEIKEEHYKIAVATELLHTATLVHDDIIDDAKMRRGQEAWHEKLGAKLAVIVGDTFLALSLKTLASICDTQISKIFSENTLDICNGEISQYFKRFEIPTLDEYLEKSRRKTALLFLCAVKSALHLSGVRSARAEEFVLDYGTAFQIKNDINSDLDLENGIYTLGSIYFKQENPNCDNIVVQGSSQIEKSKSFLNGFVDETISKLDFAKDKEELVRLCELLKE